MVALSARLEECYAGWQEDLPAEPVEANGHDEPGWRTFFAECLPPDFGAIPEDLEVTENAWPGRRGQADAPNGPHICRAFNGIAPGKVRAVVIGRDPYRNVAQATGRAFEDGAWSRDQQTLQQLAGSLKFLMLAAWATRGGEAEMFRSGGWPDLTRRPDFALPAPRTCFDALAEEGVLFVTAAWTRTREEEVALHMKLWRPVLTYLLRTLAGSDQRTVFLLLGREAQETFCVADPIYNRSAIVTTHIRDGEGSSSGAATPWNA